MTVQQKLVDFNNPVFKALLARSFKVTEGSLKHFVLPTVGDTITLGNVIYKISYVRENPYRFSAEPIGILSDDELEEAIRKAVSEPEKQKQTDVAEAGPLEKDLVDELTKGSESQETDTQSPTV